MKIEFCLIETGDIIFTKESEELKNVMNVITTVGCEIRLNITKDEIIHGYVKRVMYQVNAEENDESLRIYFSNDFKKFEHIEKLSAEHIEAVKLKEKHS